jgi:hypothetical protein
MDLELGKYLHTRAGILINGKLAVPLHHNKVLAVPANQELTKGRNFSLERNLLAETPKSLSRKPSILAYHYRELVILANLLNVKTSNM